MEEVSLKELMAAGVHFGHQTKRWNPKMRRYIFGSRNGINIIDLQKTSVLLKKSLKFARNLAANGGVILFVGTKPQAAEIIREEAERCGMPYVNERWLGGMLTNFETIKKSILRLKELDAMEEDGTFDVLAKKEVVKLRKEKDKLMKTLGGIKDMGRIPDALYMIDIKKEHIGLNEGLKLNIPVVAIVDTNCDPRGIEYMIPGNDDAVRSIRLITKSLSDAILEGAEEHAIKEQARAEEMEREAAEKKAAEEEAKKKEQEASKQAKAAEALADAPATEKNEAAGAAESDKDEEAAE